MNGPLLKQLVANRYRGPEKISEVLRLTQNSQVGKQTSARQQRLLQRRRRWSRPGKDIGGGSKQAQQRRANGNAAENHYRHATTEHTRVDHNLKHSIRGHSRNNASMLSSHNRGALPPLYPSPMSFRGIFRHRTKWRKTQMQDDLSLKDIFNSYIDNPGEPILARILLWSRQNWSLILFNLGSLSTLAAFTRTDAMELRSLSMAGSFCNAIFRFVQVPFLWIPFVWPTIFASVNAVKLYFIHDERTGFVHMNPEQQDLYNTHFLPHGVTPRQFERLYSAATLLRVPRNMPILSQGDPMNKVFLVVQGSTRGHILGRHLTAVSVNANATNIHTDDSIDDLRHSGNWIGEMTFLDRIWESEHGQKVQSKSSRAIQEAHLAEQRNTDSTIVAETWPETGAPPDALNDKASASSAASLPKPILTKATLEKSLYTILAKEECIVLCWSHEELAQIMTSSTDMRGALTRTLTSSVVSKVVRMTVNRPSSAWSRWLSEWTRKDGAVVQVAQHVPDVEPSV